jgi:adenylate kinase
MDRIARRFAEEGRADDNPDAYKVRLDAYFAQTAPLVPYYEGQGKMHSVDGMADVETVARGIAKTLDV